MDSETGASAATEVIVKGFALGTESQGGPAVVDSSIVYEVITKGPEHEAALSSLAVHEPLYISTPTVVESCMVLSRISDDPYREIQEFLRTFHVRILDFQPEHSEAASLAFMRFGKGRHAAALNFGDCLAYAVAKVAGLRLLYVGNDFARTDLGGSAG